MRYIVEKLVTFHEMTVVEAESEEHAKFIAENADANASHFLGNTILSVVDYNENDIDKFKKKDEYFFNCYATLDDEGYLLYMNPDGTVNRNMPREKIV